MTSTIKIKNSSTAGAVPGSGDLVQGELAVNVTDKKIYTKNASGTVVNLGTTPSITDNGNAEAIVIDSSENVGIGVTPSTWSLGKAIEIAVAGASLLGNGNQLTISKNAYYNAGWKYARTGDNALQYDMNGGTHAWYYAASGTAGNAITFTQAMTLDASGNLGIGTSSPSAPLDVYTSSVGVNTRLGPIATMPSSQTACYVGSSTSSVTGTGTNGDLLLVPRSSSTANIVFATGNGTPSVRAVIDSSGNLLVGTTSNPGGPGRIGVDFDSSANFGISMKSTNGSNNGVYARFYNSSAAQAGQIVQSGSTTVSYTTSSDYRLKENIAPMVGALAVVAALKPCTYTWKVDGSDGQGFIAHELQAVVPDAVVGEKDEIDADGNPEYQGIDTSFLVATLTAALQEAHGLIKDLQSRVSALES